MAAEKLMKEILRLEIEIVVPEGRKLDSHLLRRAAVFLGESPAAYPLENGEYNVFNIGGPDEEDADLVTPRWRVVHAYS